MTLLGQGLINILFGLIPQLRSNFLARPYHNMKWVQPKIAPGLNHYLSGYIQINIKTETS